MCVCLYWITTFMCDDEGGMIDFLLLLLLLAAVLHEYIRIWFLWWLSIIFAYFFTVEKNTYTHTQNTVISLKRTIRRRRRRRLPVSRPVYCCFEHRVLNKTKNCPTTAHSTPAESLTLSINVPEKSHVSFLFASLTVTILVFFYCHHYCCTGGGAPKAPCFVNTIQWQFSWFEIMIFSKRSIAVPRTDKNYSISRYCVPHWSGPVQKGHSKPP